MREHAALVGGSLPCYFLPGLPRLRHRHFPGADEHRPVILPAFARRLPRGEKCDCSTGHVGQVGYNGPVAIRYCSVLRQRPTGETAFLCREANGGKSLFFAIDKLLVFHRPCAAIGVESHRIPVCLPFRGDNMVACGRHDGVGIHWLSCKTPPDECMPRPRRSRQIAVGVIKCHALC